MAGHDRFERLAVGHVLGGLDEVDRAAFRAHLLECADCRRRVNELRDIASDLARTEREERRAGSAGAVEVETETRTDGERPEATEVAPMRQWPWGVVVIGLVPLLILGTLAWAVWQRAQTDLTAAVAESQQQVLDVLATGAPVPFETPESVTGLLAVDEDTIAVNLAGISDLRPDEVLVIWLVAAGGETLDRTRPYLPSQVDGRVVAALDRPAGDARLVVSIETELPLGDGPAGYQVVTAELPGLAADAGDVSQP